MNCISIFALKSPHPGLSFGSRTLRGPQGEWTEGEPRIYCILYVWVCICMHKPHWQQSTLYIWIHYITEFIMIIFGPCTHAGRCLWLWLFWKWQYVFIVHQALLSVNIKEDWIPPGFNIFKHSVCKINIISESINKLFCSSVGTQFAHNSCFPKLESNLH